MSLHGTRVLLVEDDPTFSLSWANILTRLGARVLGPCPTVGRAMFLLGTERPQVALLDIQLRDGNSFPIARALALMRTPFVFLSDGDPRDLPTEFCATPYLQQPATIANVLATLERATQRESDGVSPAPR